MPAPTQKMSEMIQAISPDADQEIVYIAHMLKVMKEQGFHGKLHIHIEGGKCVRTITEESLMVPLQYLPPEKAPRRASEKSY